MILNWLVSQSFFLFFFSSLTVRGLPEDWGKVEGGGQSHSDLIIPSIPLPVPVNHEVRRELEPANLNEKVWLSGWKSG